MSRLSRWFLAILLLAGLFTVAHSFGKARRADGLDLRTAPVPAGGLEVHLRSDPLPMPLTIPGDPHSRQITSVEIEGRIPGDEGKGTVVLDERAMKLNAFGDATPQGDKKPLPRAVTFRKVPAGSFPTGPERQVFEIVFEDGSLARLLYLVLSRSDGYFHSLLVFPPGKAGAEKIVPPSEVPVRVLELDGRPVRPDPIGDGKLRPEVRFRTLYLVDRQPKQCTIEGNLNGAGHLTLDPNWLMLDLLGKVRGSTLLACFPAPVQIKQADDPDPAKKGRRLYHLVPEKGAPLSRHQFSLVLSPNEAGPHRLLVQEAGAIRQVIPVIDSGREEHLQMAPQLATVSDQEKKAVVRLRQILGYRFTFRVDRGALRHLHITTPIDADAIDEALPGLRNLEELYFEGGQLRAVGLPNLKHVTALKGLSFQGSRIDDAGLACVKDRTTLTQMWFFGCRGLSDKGVAHFRNLKNLTLLDLRNEDFTEKERPDPRITDAGLAHLGGLTKLTYLNLQGHKVTDAGLGKLAGLQNLEFLALSFSGVTDAGLVHLYGMQRLRSLHLYNTRITPEGRARLKARLPQLTVY
jgi:hypothetical protein